MPHTREARLKLIGEIDMAWAAANDDIVRGLLDNHPARVVVDVGAVTFIDSTGLGLLVRCLKVTQRQVGGEVVVVDPSHLFMRTLTISGLDKLVTIENGQDVTDRW